MKQLLSYFDREGNPIGKKLDSARRKKFFVVFATIRKKISEHEGQNPFRKKQYGRKRVRPFSKNYCDENRAFVEIDVFEDGKKIKTVRKTRPIYYGETPTDEHRTILKICDHISRNTLKYLQNENLEYVFIMGLYSININRILGQQR